MKTIKTPQPIAGLCVLILTALSGTARLTAQEAAPAAPQAAANAPAAPAAEVRYEVQASRSAGDGGRNIIIQRVSPPVLPVPPAPVVRPPLTPAQLAARAAARAARPAPMKSRLLSLNVTVFAEGQTYIEWWPQTPGDSFAAWSNADFRYLSLAPDFDIVSDNTRYSIFPFGIYTYKPRPGRPPRANLPVPVAIPADGPGFVLVKGDPADKATINPITALHQIYKEDGALLKAAWEERERLRLEEEAWSAANPPPPPGDVVIRFWPVKSKRYPTAALAAPAAAQTPSPSNP